MWRFLAEQIGNHRRRRTLIQAAEQVRVARAECIELLALPVQFIAQFAVGTLQISNLELEPLNRLVNDGICRICHGAF